MWIREKCAFCNKTVELFYYTSRYTYDFEKEPSLACSKCARQKLSAKFVIAYQASDNSEEKIHLVADGQARTLCGIQRVQVRRAKGSIVVWDYDITKIEPGLDLTNHKACKVCFKHVLG